MDRPEERLALIECFERDGRAGRTVDVHAWPLTLGRALSNHVILDDAYVAARHARIEPGSDGRLLLTVLDTANGVAVDGRRHDAGTTSPLPEAGAPAAERGPPQEAAARRRRHRPVLAPDRRRPRPRRWPWPWPGPPSSA